MSAHRRSTLQTISIIGILACLCLAVLTLSCGKKEQVPEEEAAGEKAAAAPEAPQAQAVQAYGQLPLSFTENNGQVAQPVRFYLRGSRGTVYFTPEEVVYDVVEQTARPDRRHPGEGPETAEPDTAVRRRGVVVRMKLEGADDDLVLEGLGELQGKVNIFRGKDPDQWKTNIRTFSSIVYRDLYSGIDLTYRGQAGRLAPRLTVQPKARVDQIAFRYEGADSIFVDDQGRLRIVTALGTITEPAPSCYQEKGEDRTAVRGRYRLREDDLVGFEVGKWSKDRPLIISLAGGE